MGEHKCDECGKDCGYIEFEHEGVTTEKAWCTGCSWHHIVVDGEEQFRGVFRTPVEGDEDSDTLEETSTKEALKRLLSFARKLANYDTGDTSKGTFHILQYIAQDLGGLKDAVDRYDDTVAFFAKDREK